MHHINDSQDATSLLLRVSSKTTTARDEQIEKEISVVRSLGSCCFSRPSSQRIVALDGRGFFLLVFSRLIFMIDAGEIM